MNAKPLVLATMLLATGLGSTQAAQAARTTKASITKLTVSNTKVTVRGRVRLPKNTARMRRRTRVLVTLTSATGKVERFKKVRIDAKRRFNAGGTTTLTGSLTVAIRVTIGGKKSGKVVKRKITVVPLPPAGPLSGTLKLDAGEAPAGRPPRGTWFQMLFPGGGPLQNSSSSGANKNYTPLAPGTDGGLRLDAYQRPPTPAFAGGDALANRIIQPTSFFNVDFSVVTSPTDPQLGVFDPPPEIKQADGKLSGQVTAWAAQWNNQSFNQGTPKPDGTTPPPTTPVSGTYEASKRKFTLDWRSLIVGGPFNGFTGVWHLEGTFAPAP